MSTILAWHNDPALKARAVELMRKHRADDDFIHGNYLLAGMDGNEYKGCFHGCLTTEALAAELGKTIDEMRALNRAGAIDWHGEGERIWGIPYELGSLLDDVFENCRHPDDGRFAVESVEAIPVGADLTAIDVDELEERYEADYDESIVIAALAAAPVPAVTA